MNYRYTWWCFLALFMVCAYACGSLGLTVVSGLSLFFWTALICYYRLTKVKN